MRKMKKIKEHKFDDLLKEAMQNEQFRKEYEKLEEEFQLAEEVIKLRVEKNLSQKELAKIAGTSQPAIDRLESGKYRNVSLSFLRRIGKALDCVPEIHFKKAQ
jgi:DNA-binding Xre family transcriptional regulator